MSDDNWAKCPNCIAVAQIKAEQAKKKAEKSYGKVSPSKYLELVQMAENPPLVRETLREDYELGVTLDGRFYVSYGCSCRQCGFEYEFEKEEKIDRLQRSAEQKGEA